MSKQLILFRHGKSEREAESGQDHDRPVAPRGLEAAKVMGQVMAMANYLPDAVITSSARRAHTTAELAAAAGGWPTPLVSDELYEASPLQVLQLMRLQPDTTQRLLLVGHQPTWSELTSLLTGGGAVAVPTAALVCLEFDVERWKDVSPSGGVLRWLLPPKFFTEGSFALG